MPTATLTRCDPLYLCSILLRILMATFQITTLLPIGNGTNGTTPFRSTLNNALRLSGPRKLSGFAGSILISWLYGSSLRHADFALCQNQADGPNYDFWRHHYHISESVSQLICASDMDFTLQSTPTEPAVLYLKIIFQAVLMCLYHAAVTHESKTNLKESPNLESETKCFQAAMSVTSLTRQIKEQAEIPASVSSRFDALSLCCCKKPY